MEKFLVEVQKLAYEEVEKTGLPVKETVDLVTQKGKRVAKKLGVNVDIVEAGTLLMDCMLGQAIKENRRNEHIQMSLDKANELLDQSSLSEKDKENIRHCVLEHHGVDQFYSLESEICCNVDCYKFISLKGFLFSLRYTRAMSFEDLITLLKDKANEKWNALSLDVVKKELTPQYEIISKMLEGLEDKK